ncbi:MAG: hypothetical protein WAU05_07170, partial [Nitrospira sp.]
APAFQGLHTFRLPIAMYKAMTETPYNVRIDKPACYHAFRYSLATHLLENGYDVSTTMIYTHPNKWHLDKD